MWLAGRVHRTPGASTTGRSSSRLRNGARCAALSDMSLAGAPGERVHRVDEHRRPRTDDAGADLTDAWFTSGDAGVDDGQDAGAHDQSGVDAGRTAAEVEPWNLVQRMLGQRDLIHPLGAL